MFMLDISIHKEKLNRMRNTFLTEKRIFLKTLGKITV